MAWAKRAISGWGVYAGQAIDLDPLYEPAQVVTRLLSVATYALVLPALFRVFELSALDAALIIGALF
jgi:hypothetical protein